MKPYCLLIMLLMSALLMAQNPTTKVTPSGAYGPGGRLETTTTTDEFGRTITTEKYYDAKNRLREEFTTTRKLDNSATEETTIQYRDNGTVRTETKWEKYDNGDKKMEHKVYDEDGNVKEGEIYIERGKKTYQYKWDTTTKKFEGYDQVALNFPDNKNQLICAVPRYEIFAAYSFLIGSSYPLGAHLNFKHNLTDKIGIGLDLSVHRKKEGDLSIRRSFVLIDGHYVLGDRTDCDRDWFLNVHVLAGIGIDGVKYKGTYSSSSSETGPAFGGGLGGVIRLNKKVQATVNGDVIMAQWADEWFDNTRLSAGIVYSF